MGVEPILLLQEVEARSVISWLRTQLKGQPGQGQLDEDEERGVKKFLLDSKAAVMGFLGRNETVNSRGDISALKQDLRAIADEELPVGNELRYHPLSDDTVVSSLARLGESLTHLQDHDSVSFLTPDGGEQTMNVGFRVSEDAVEELLTRDRYENTNRMILKIKKPDYLGDSRWELRHGKHTVEAHIADAGWLSEFRNRSVPLAPGDALNADVRSVVLYGYDGEVLRTRYDVLKVHGTQTGDRDHQGELLS